MQEGHSEKDEIGEYISLECRWFFINPIPEVFLNMFRNVEIQSRTDTYWIREIQKRNSKISEGIKLREGRFEVKALLQSYSNSLIPAKIQKWTKKTKSIPKDLEPDKYWFDVPKRRQLIKYEISEGKLSGPVAHYPSQGCNIEITRFGPPIENYWTFGFEAYGVESMLWWILEETFKRVSVENTSLIKYLDRKNARSYPEWISELAR